MQKLDEAATQLVEIAGVGRHVIGVDVGHYRQHRLQVHERRVAFVSLGHQVLALAEPGIGVGALQAAANDESRVQAAFAKHARDQAGGGCLAVRASHGDRIAKAHQLRQHLRARHDRLQRLPCGEQLRVRFIDCAGHHHRIRVAHVLGRVTDKNRRAVVLQPGDLGISLQVGPLDLVTETQHDFGDAGHTRAADTDKMDPVDSAHPLDHVRAPASSRHKPVMRSSASGIACSRALTARRQSSSRLPSHSANSAASDGPVISCSAMIAAAPASASSRALTV